MQEELNPNSKQTLFEATDRATEIEDAIRNLEFDIDNPQGNDKQIAALMAARYRAAKRGLGGEETKRSVDELVEDDGHEAEIQNTDEVLEDPPTILGEDSANELAPSSTEEMSPDQYTDVEILGKSFLVRRTVNEVGNTRIKLVEGGWAKIRNILSSPRKAVRELAVKSARSSYDSKTSRLGRAETGRLTNLRQESVDRAKEKLNKRTGSLSEIEAVMDERTAHVENKVETRRQEMVSELKGKKEQALARKHLREQLRSEGAKRSEVREILADITPGQIARVGKIAVTAEISRRYAAGAEKTEKREASKRKYYEKRILSNQDRLAYHSEQAINANIEFERINSEISYLERLVEALQAELSVMPDNSEGNDAKRQDVMAKLQEIQKQISIYRTQEIPRWESVVSQSHEEVKRLEALIASLHETSDEKQEVVVSASGNTQEKRSVYEEHRAQLRQATNESLDQK